MSDEVFSGIDPGDGGAAAEAPADRVSWRDALARYVCTWLDATDELWDFVHAWRDDFTSDRTGEKSFTRVVGKTPAQASADWVRWVKSVARPAAGR